MLYLLQQNWIIFHCLMFKERFRDHLKKLSIQKKIFQVVTANNLNGSQPGTSDFDKVWFAKYYRENLK